jgi:DNA-binding MarR family transcriptional regulator
MRFEEGGLKIEDDGSLKELLEGYKAINEKFEKILQLLQTVVEEIQVGKQKQLEIMEEKMESLKRQNRKLTPQQQELLQYVDGNRTVSEIAKAANKDAGWVSRTLKTLEKRGEILAARQGNKTIYTINKTQEEKQ